MIMQDKIDFEILNGFISMVIMTVAQKYVDKLKKDKKMPPKFVESYLDSSVFLLKKYHPIEISKVKNTIDSINEEEQKAFDEFFKEDKEYEFLCKELNFAFLLMIDEKLQVKTLNLIYDNIYEYKILINQELITKKQIDIEKVIEKANQKKITKLQNFNNINQTVMTTL
ncbi:hypothetical protein [Spiroplasma attinicola]|uniref:hypothetical protein n=1 Tax=Spiroplasma attinicola TaxID=2904537 RepID=UPI002022A898|nr:hypothetical protein [Spiroplasma sp. JKS002670]